MTRENSPYYAQGRVDGRADRMRVESCPGSGAEGPDPDYAWSVMYRRGYWEAFGGARQHLPCRVCSPVQRG